MEPKT